jgi:hypothetical protein
LTAAAVMVVANTGGTGIAGRTDCQETAQIPGVAFSDGTALRVIARGVGTCTGWQLADANGRQVWIRAGYLAAPPPAAVAPPVATPVFIPYPGNGGGPTQCADGMYSHSSGRGTCSHHGGIAGGRRR